MEERLPSQIIEALKKYYFHRKLANEGIAKWDKTADLVMLDKIIESECKEWGYSAIAGTFWFRKEITPSGGEKTYIEITVNEQALKDGQDLIFFFDEKDLKRGYKT
jgi:hypothetical protein